MEKAETKLEEAETRIKTLNASVEIIMQQHLEVITQVRHLSKLQTEIAQQVVVQHEELEQLYIALGLKKPLSYYSFNMTDAQEH